jgi:hypothetical protein
MSLTQSCYPPHLRTCPSQSTASLMPDCCQTSLRPSSRLTHPTAASLRHSPSDMRAAAQSVPVAVALVVFTRDRIQVPVDDERPGRLAWLPGERADEHGKPAVR